MRIVTPSEPAEKKALSEQALIEFKVAVEIWFRMMDDRDRLLAVNYASEAAGTMRGK